MNFCCYFQLKIYFKESCNSRNYLFFIQCKLMTHSKPQEHRTFFLFTCGKHHVPGDQFVVHYGELREFDSCHSGHSIFSSHPVKLYIICCVTICKNTSHKA